MEKGSAGMGVNIREFRAQMRNFGLERTKKQAAFFYIYYCAAIFIITTLACGLLAHNHDQVLRTVWGVGGLLLAALTFSVLRAKKLIRTPYVLALPISVAGILGGVFIGMLPAAYLTTRKNGAS